MQIEKKIKISENNLIHGNIIPKLNIFASPWIFLINSAEFFFK